MNSVVEQLRRLVDTDPSACTTSDQLSSLTAETQRLRAWLDAYEVRIARRTSELADSGASGTPTEMLADGGRRRAREAAAAAARAELCAEMPQFETALATGSVSSGHVDAVARAAKELSESQRDAFAQRAAELVVAAQDSTVEAFEHDCRTLARQIADDAGTSRHEALRKQRRLRRWIDHDTCMHKTLLELDPEHDAKIAAALRAALRDRFDDMINPNVDWRHVEIDTLVELITGARAVHPRVPEVSVLIDLQTLSDAVHDATVAETSDGIPLPPDAIRRLACDADIIPIVLGGAGDVLDEGRARRLATAAQRRAVNAMHRSCIFPDCTIPVDDCRIHHTDPWHANGRTDLDTLVPVCETHHHRLHEGGWTLTITPDRTITITRPDGIVIYDGPSVDRTHGPPSRAPAA